MHIRAAIAAGFLLNALLGPWCMVAAPVAEHAHGQHAHHAHCSDCAHHGEGAPEDGCLGHCLVQAKSVFPAHGISMPALASGFRDHGAFDGVTVRVAAGSFESDDWSWPVRPPGMRVLRL